MVVISFHKPFSCLVESKLQPAGHFSDDQWQSSAGEGGEAKYREFIGKKVSFKHHDISRLGIEEEAIAEALCAS